MNNGKKLLSKAKWIWPQTDFYDLYNTYAHFRKDFTLETVPEDGTFYITADQGYRLWVNGIYVTRGPARGYQAHWPFDEIEIAKYLRKGGNYISVEVFNPGISTFSYVSQTRAGLLCAGDLGDSRIRSDGTWISRLDVSHKKDTARYSLQINFQEHINTAMDDRTWITSDSFKGGKDWVSPEETVFGSMPWYDLEEREIPLLKETLRTPLKIVAEGQGIPGEGYSDWRNVISGVFDELKTMHWKRSIETLASSITLPGKFGLNAVVLDMGELVVGPVSIKVEGGVKGQIVDLCFSEVLDKNGIPVFLHPDQNHSRISMGNRLILSGSSVSFDFFQILGFRYILLITRENENAIQIKLSVNDTGYPYALEGSFETSDATLNDIWKVCRRTEQVCSLDSYVDTPWREQAQWWGDARVQFWNTIAIDGDARLFKRGIRSIAGQNVPNGLTYGHAPTMAHSCILPDFSLVWILSIYDYYLQTGDISLFEELLPRIQEVLSYFEDSAPKLEGLLGYDERFWLFLDWSDLEKQGAPALYNMWYLMTLRTLGIMHNLIGNDKKADEFRLCASQLEASMIENLFDNEQKLFCDGISVDGTPSQKHSVHSQTLAMMLGLMPEFENVMFEKRILPFLKGEQIDAAIPSSYWASYVLTIAREKGFHKEVLNYIRRMWEPVIPYGTCPETFDGYKGDTSYSHAWSAHPVFHLMHVLGGVVQESKEWETISFNPFLSEELEWVRVKQPTPKGIIESSWKRNNGKVKVYLKLPEGITAKVKLPGYEKIVTGCLDWEV